jgi:hypothetical protein
MPKTESAMRNGAACRPAKKVSKMIDVRHRNGSALMYEVPSLLDTYTTSANALENNLLRPEKRSHPFTNPT